MPDYDSYLDRLIEENAPVDDVDDEYTREDWEEDIYDEFEYLSD